MYEGSRKAGRKEEANKEEGEITQPCRERSGSAMRVRRERNSEDAMLWRKHAVTRLKWKIGLANSAGGLRKLKT